MAYDEALAERIRDALTGVDGVSEKKMFGGLSFLINGNMACGVVKEAFCARVGAEAQPHALAQPHARPMDFTKRPMKSMVFVDAPGVESDADLATWVQRCVAFAGSLPPK